MQLSAMGKKSSRMTILWNNGENDGLALELGGELIFKVYIFKAGLGSQQYHG